MHAARLGKSKRLQATLAVLRRGPATTRDLMTATGSVAPHSDVAELRANGIAIECRHARDTETGRRVYVYCLPADEHGARRTG